MGRRAPSGCSKVPCGRTRSLRHILRSALALPPLLRTGRLSPSCLPRANGHSLQRYTSRRPADGPNGVSSGAPCIQQGEGVVTPEQISISGQAQTADGCCKPAFSSYTKNLESRKICLHETKYRNSASCRLRFGFSGDSPEEALAQAPIFQVEEIVTIHWMDVTILM